MSRYGKSPIALPKGVEVKVEGTEVKIKGPKGELKETLHTGLSITIEDNILHVVQDEKVEMPKPIQGLYRSLINNMVIGVSKGFEKRLSMIGVGFRAAVQGGKLDLQIGFSHPTKLDIPKELKVDVEKNVTIVISGINKHSVGQFAASVRAKKPPEPYKGKGIRYENEYVRKKAGKAAKGKSA
jgi:large subunit ribosomal protein L6